MDKTTRAAIVRSYEVARGDEATVGGGSGEREGGEGGARAGG
jgi:hypothetical protein